MAAARWRTILWLLFVVAGIGPVLLAGCSTAGRMLVARDPRPAPSADHEHPPFDLMPATSPRNPGARPASPRAIEVSGALHASPDGKWIAFESDQDGVHGVWVARPDGERARRVSGSRLALRPRWSPDGTRLMFLGHDSKRADAWNIWIADPDEAAPRKVTSGGSVSLAGASWFPDSRHICYGSDKWLIVADITSNTARAFRLPADSSRVAGVPAVSPDGRLIVFAVEGEGAWMASLGDGAITQIVSERDVDAFAWAPGGRQIAFRNARDGQWKVRIVK
jgi:TolB protein